MVDNMIIMTELAYNKFLKFVLQHANPYKSRNSWQEVIGFLFGRFKSKDEDENKYEVIITDVLPMDSGSAVYVKVGDYSSVYPVLSKKLENEEFIVGWIHSHPGLGLFLSSTDVNTQSIYQQMDPRSVAIVVDHTKISSDFSGMKCFKVSKKSSHSYDSFSIDIARSNNLKELIRDFKPSFNNILSQISPEALIVSPKLSNNIVEIDDIKLNVKGPNKWHVKNENIPILILYETRESGFVKISYSLKLDSGNLLFENKLIRIHNVYQSGVIAFLQISLRDISKSLEKISFSVRELEITNRDNKKVRLDPIELDIKLIK